MSWLQKCKQSADFENVRDQLTFKNVNNHCQFPKNSTKNSQRTPKELPKNSPQNAKTFPRFWKNPIPFIALRGRKPFRACLIFQRPSRTLSLFNLFRFCKVILILIISIGKHQYPKTARTTRGQYNSKQEQKTPHCHQIGRNIMWILFVFAIRTNNKHGNWQDKTNKHCKN